MWTRAEQKGQNPTTAAMIASTVSSKILQTRAEREGFLFEETLTGFKWMANRGLQLQKEGYQILFAFEGSLDKLDTHWLVLVNRMDSLCSQRLLDLCVAFTFRIKTAFQQPLICAKWLFIWQTKDLRLLGNYMRYTSSKKLFLHKLVIILLSTYRLFRYGHHVSLVSYYLCYDLVVINRIFERLRNFDDAPKTVFY